LSVGGTRHTRADRRTADPGVVVVVEQRGDGLELGDRQARAPSRARGDRSRPRWLAGSLASWSASSTRAGRVTFATPAASRKMPPTILATRPGLPPRRSPSRGPAHSRTHRGRSACARLPCVRLRGRALSCAWGAGLASVRHHDRPRARSALLPARPGRTRLDFATLRRPARPTARGEENAGKQVRRCTPRPAPRSPSSGTSPRGGRLGWSPRSPPRCVRGPRPGRRRRYAPRPPAATSSPPPGHRESACA
jgi:hypothetical protein